MNYQLMFQTIAFVFAIAAVITWCVAFFSDHISEKVRRNLLYIHIILFIITLITGALAAGLSWDYLLLVVDATNKK